MHIKSHKGHPKYHIKHMKKVAPTASPNTVFKGFFTLSMYGIEKFQFLSHSEGLGLRIRRRLGPLSVALMILQASWCMRPSSEQPLIDRTSSPTLISPDSSAAPPVTGHSKLQSNENIEDMFI